VTPATEHIAGAPRDILSDEDPDDPLIAARKRAEAQRQSGRAYREAHWELQDVTDERSFSTSIRRAGRTIAGPQWIIQPVMMILSGTVSVVGLSVAAVGTLISGIGELGVARQLRKMRAAITESPTAKADRLVYELHRAEALADWVQYTHSRLPFARRFGQWRATRAYHRAVEASVAALADPECTETAKAVLAASGEQLEGLLENNKLSWRSERRHLNALHRHYEATRDPVVADVLFREVARCAARADDLLRAEVRSPNRFLPIRTHVAESFIQWRRERKVESLRHRGYRNLALDVDCSPQGIRDAVPGFLSGRRGYMRRLFRQADRVVTLRESEAYLLRTADLPADAVAAWHGDTTVPPRVRIADRIAELRVMQYELGDPSVSRDDVVAATRHLVYLSGAISGVPKSVVDANQARMDRLGITMSDLTRDVATTPVATPTGAVTHVSPERIGEIFASAQSARDGGIAPPGHN
jgi:hypothetical protein